jgi:hypothetical protein
MRRFGIPVLVLVAGLAVAACGGSGSNAGQAQTSIAGQSATAEQQSTGTSKFKAEAKKVQPADTQVPAVKLPARPACRIMTLGEVESILGEGRHVGGIYAPKDEPSACGFGAERNPARPPSAVDAYFVMVNVKLYCGQDAEEQYPAWAYSRGVDNSHLISEHVRVNPHNGDNNYFMILRSGCMVLSGPALDMRKVKPGVGFQFTDASRTAAIAAMEAVFNRT